MVSWNPLSENCILTLRALMLVKPRLACIPQYGLFDIQWVTRICVGKIIHTNIYTHIYMHVICTQKHTHDRYLPYNPQNLLPARMTWKNLISGLLCLMGSANRRHSQKIKEKTVRSGLLFLWFPLWELALGCLSLSIEKHCFFQGGQLKRTVSSSRF